jgi:hypothetical protein
MEERKMYFWKKLAQRRQVISRPLGLIPLLLMASLMVAGCGLLSGPAEPTPTPTREIAQGQLVPTWTPTPLLPTETPQPVLPTPEPVVLEPATPTPQPVDAEPTALPTDTPAPATARFTVTGGNAINVRRGPGTSFGIVGTVNNGMVFDIQGKNPAGDWYQFCCVNGEQGWIYGPLIQVENAQLVAVAQNIPAPPPTNTPAPVAVAPPTNTPVPQAPAPAPAPEGDPCANIGGDGCKFKLTGGPRFGNNGGMELKLQLFFIHSGVDGGQPQGSYFIVLEKDGQRLPISDSVRSIALQRSEGALGAYNYEYKIGASSLPGGTVAGNYVGWVLDGNGERDSRNFSFSVPEGQGEVWLQLDQG